MIKRGRINQAEPKRNVEQGTVDVHTILSAAWDLARNGTRPETRNRARAIALFMKMLHSRYFTHKSGSDKLFYWQHGSWPNQLM